MDKAIAVGSAAAGGAGSVVISEKMKIEPMYGVLSAGAIAALGMTVSTNPKWRDGFFAAGLGAGGVGLAEMARSWTQNKAVASKLATPAAPTNGPAASTGYSAANTGARRQADGTSQPYVTQDQLNGALAQLAEKNADQHRQTCDLMAVLHEEMRKVFRESTANENAGATKTATSPAASPTRDNDYLYPVAQAPRTPPQDYYEANAYGERARSGGTRNASNDDYRNCDGGPRNDAGDEYRNDAGDEYRNDAGDEYRNDAGDEYRNDAGDDYRNDAGDDYRNDAGDGYRNDAVADA